MKELTVREHEGINAIDSREVAEMMEVQHKDLLKKIDSINEDFGSEKVRHEKYWQESTFENRGKQYRNFLVTKRGCEFLAHKTTGTKGNLFTDRYMDRFEQMKEHIKNEQIVNIGELSPELQMFKQIFDTVAKQELEQKQLKKDIEDNRKELQGIREVITISTDNWRDDCNNLIKKIGIKAGGYSSIQDVRVEIYNALDKRMGVKLQTRLENKRDRMRKEGIGKTKIKKVNCLDIIAEDKKLIEGYVAIVKEMAIKFGVDKE